MTDEQFIRAIVDHPADDLPRMAYADWLEEQSDPRYVYLLVEKEAVRTGDISMLKDLAGGYDPVGVARVSRPPVGICCDHIQYADSGPIVTRTMIDTFEEESARRDLKYGGHPEPFFVGLPDGYRALMLNSNGGETNELTFSVPGVENIKPFTARVRLRFFRFGEKITIEDPTGPWGLWLSLATAIDIDDPHANPMNYYCGLIRKMWAVCITYRYPIGMIGRSESFPRSQHRFQLSFNY